MATQEESLNGIVQNVLNLAQIEADRIITQASEYAKSLERIVEIKVEGQAGVQFPQGAHPLLPDLVRYMKNDLMPLLVGPAGCGKSTLAQACAEVMGLQFGHLCFSAGVSEVWLFGRHTPQGFKEAEFSRMYREGGLFLADELDAADPNVLLAINTALSADYLYNPISGESIRRSENFYFIGAANTYGKGANGSYVGRNRLDAATLDRFLCIEVGYLEQIEKQLCPDYMMRVALQRVRQVLAGEGSKEIVSYRSFAKAAKLLALGHTKSDVLKKVFASFPEDLLKRVINAAL